MAHVNPDKRSGSQPRSRPPAAGEIPLLPAHLHPHVVHWDRVMAHRGIVERACAACGTGVSHCDSLGHLRKLLATRACAAGVVALDASEPCLEAIALLRRANLPVIAHEDGLHAWTVSARCRILLAGANHLLASAAADFEDNLRACLGALLASLAKEREEEARIRELAAAHGVVGRSEGLLGAFRNIVRFSRLSDLPVLITGESGTGKELFACALHALDPKRRAHPLVAVNCAAISAGIAESELFGHVRGAFTGAHRDHPGLFLEAQGGVLFLDEIAELDPAVQAKILRVLQERRMIRVGSGHDAEVDIRIVAATNKDLGRMAKEGSFRLDLFHRLSTLAVHIPPLRERRPDIAPLVEHIVSAHASWREPTGVDPGLLEALGSLRLEGNVRELRNLIAGAQAAKSDRLPLGLKDLPAHVWRELSPAPDTPAAAVPAAQPPGELASSVAEKYGWNLADCLTACEREIMAAALRRTRNNQTQAARLLGLTPRSVYNKIRKHRLPHASFA